MYEGLLIEYSKASWSQPLDIKARKDRHDGSIISKFQTSLVNRIILPQNFALASLRKKQSFDLPGPSSQARWWSQPRFGQLYRIICTINQYFIQSRLSQAKEVMDSLPRATTTSNGWQPAAEAHGPVGPRYRCSSSKLVSQDSMAYYRYIPQCTPAVLIEPLQ